MNLLQPVKGNILKERFFTKEKGHQKLHGHCQQNIVVCCSFRSYYRYLRNYTVRNDSIGCCGMAGSTDYEEHYDLSMKLVSWCCSQQFVNKQIFIIAAPIYKLPP
jgi:hypothetical protein